MLACAALVIGNGDEPLIPLDNPLNNARERNRRLTELGFSSSSAVLAAPVTGDGMADVTEAGEPLAHGLRADLEGVRRSGHAPATLEHAPHHHCSTRGRRAGILMSDSSGWFLGSWRWIAPTTCQALGRMNTLLRDPQLEGLVL